MELYSRSLLTESELVTIRHLLEGATWESQASDTNIYLAAHQKNSEMADSEGKREIYRIVMDAIGRDDGFRDRVFPKQSTYAIVSKTETGQGFKVHHDMPTNGDYSTTVFISSPDEYEGGQLTMFLGSEERKFALPAGYALTYSTGIPHCVKEVTRGTRYAIVFWTTSLIRDPRWREILTDLRRVKSLLPREYGYNLEETTNDPHFLVQGIENKIVRYFIND